MYPVAHVAVAVGGAWLGERLLKRVRGFAPVASVIDYRFIAAGALIPDVIDKPLARAGIEALSYEQTAGHTIGHTLLFALCLTTAGAVLARRGDRRLLWLGLGDLTHLLVDPVIAYPGVLAWPLLGSEFPRSSGIPSWPYLIGSDLMLVAAGVLVYRKCESFREWMWRFVTARSMDGFEPLDASPLRQNT